MTPFNPVLLDVLEAVTCERVTGTVWRQVLAPTSAARPNQRGGRWNPPGTETLYCSLDADTAAAEIDNLLAAQPVPITRQRYTYAVDIRLSHVADLRNDEGNAPFDYPYDMSNTDHCQTVGAAAAWLELSGLIVPSLRHNGANLVMFVANLEPTDFFDIDKQFAYPPGPPAAESDAGITIHT